MLNWLIGMGSSVIMLMFIFMIVIPILAIIFWIWMIVDCLTKDFKHDTDKIAWILVIIFTFIIGALIYFFIVKMRRR